MMRNTAPIAWPPLLLYKVIYERSLKSFLIAGFTVFLPIIAISVGLDTFYYGSGEGGYPVFTSLNFLKVNVVEGLSKYFGTDPIHAYLTGYMIHYLTVAYPFVLISMGVYGYDTVLIKKAKINKEPPFILIFTVLYVGVFSLIKHKEARFILPIIPFCFFMLGH